MMHILPVRFTKGHKWVDGYRVVWAKGEYVVRKVGEAPTRYWVDYSPVKYQILVANWALYLPHLPDRIWQRVRAMLWRDRSARHFERGLAAGLRQAYYEPSRIDTLTQEERAGLFGITADQVRRLDNFKGIESWMPADLVAHIKKEAAEALAEIASQEKP